VRNSLFVPVIADSNLLQSEVVTNKLSGCVRWEERSRIRSVQEAIYGLPWASPKSCKNTVRPPSCGKRGSFGGFVEGLGGGFEGGF